MSPHSLNEADNTVYNDPELGQRVPGEEEDEDGEEEVDLDKTKEGLWSLLTGQYQTVMKYESVFKFIEESMPQLKRVQQENMRIQV